MINLIFTPIQKALTEIQRVISIILSNWLIVLLALGMGFTLEEIINGLRIIKLLGIGI